MGFQNTRQNMKGAKGGTGTSKAAKAGDDKTARFDPMSPWPIGTVIKFQGGGTAMVAEIIHHGGGLIVLEWLEGRTPDDLNFYSFDDWNDDMAHLVDAVEFPAEEKAEGGRRKAKSRKRLEWMEDTGKDAWQAASVAYGSTEGGLTWRVRPKLKGKGWSLGASDGELIAGLPKSVLGFHADLDVAKSFCQALDFKAWPKEAEESEAAPDVTSGNNPQSAIRNPQSRPPRAEMIMIPVERIDASRNVRTSINEATLFDLAASIADVGMLEPVLVRKIPVAGKDAPGWRMIAGHQRLEAARRAGEEYIEAKVYAGDGVDDVWETKARAAENFIRSDLNHIELARLFGQDADAGLSVSEIAALHHVGDDHVRRHLALRRLCAPVADLVASGRLPLHQADLISRVGDGLKQIALAEDATRLQWRPSAKGAAGKWTARGVFDYRAGKHKPGPDEQDPDDRDYIEPMEQLRKAVANAMQGLAACGWPMDESYAGEMACTGCPDNTLTHADQPALFEGINPQGSDKKGHCTHSACYAAKKKAWDKVLDQRRKKRDAELKKTIATAKKMGLPVCEGHKCGRIIAAGEKVETVNGLKLCAKCAAKAKKREASGRGGGGGESYDARHKRVAAMKKRFPETPDEKLAVAQHHRGAAIAEAIGKAIAEGWQMPDGTSARVAEMILWAYSIGGWGLETPKDRYITLDAVLGGGIPDADLATWWMEAVQWASGEDSPCIAYDGKVENVPLPKAHADRIGELERLAAACGAAVPPVPTPREIAAAETRKAVLTAGRADLPADLKAITHGDVIILQTILADAEAGTLQLDGKAVKMPKWRDAAILARIGEIRGFHGDPRPFARAAKKEGEKGGRRKAEGESQEKQKEPGPGAPLDRFFCTRDCCGCPMNCAMPGDFHERMRNSIRMDKKPDAVPAIERCADVEFLKEAQRKGLTGDWRRAAVAKRIEQLREDDDVETDRQALTSDDEGEDDES